ncbi:uncharacterized protein LOC142813923 [Rhipicephalus microplus]|uniref:uncharacterized protein LOC142813923 n=1 Tax=Rhipicephalus microplus TaxID=6941 RepID=UPI003F6D4088
MQRVPPPPWGAADVWAYPNLYSDAFAGNPRPLVFALVMTSPDRREQRNAIRETWGRESSYPKHMFRLVFFMNMVPHQNETQIKAEVNAYNDLVVQPSGSLSSLSSLMTEWATERIWISRLVLLLSRDDCFVNVRALLTNAYQLMRGNFDVTGRRRDAKRVENAKRSTAKGSHVAKEDVEDAGGKYRRNGRDHGVAVDLAPFEPCVLLVRGYNVFRQFQSVWAWFDSNASFADESFFSGRIALKAKATLAHVDAVGPCMGERLSSTFRRSGTLTSCGHPVVKVRALHKELVQRLSNAAKKRNETALLIAQWKRALTPERID